MPQSILRFKQVRAPDSGSEDRGVCAVLDRRIVTRRYGQSFIASLPECRVERGSTEDAAYIIEEFLDESPSEAQNAFPT